MRNCHFLTVSGMVLCVFVAPAVAQVVYNGSEEHRRTGVYKSITVIKTDAETGDVFIKQETEKEDAVKIKSCVEYNGGECIESEYFQAIIKDVDVEK